MLEQAGYAAIARPLEFQEERSLAARVERVRIDRARDPTLVERTLARSRRMVTTKLSALFEERRRTGYGPLYDLLADYPFREAKGLTKLAVVRPAWSGMSSTAWAKSMMRSYSRFHVRSSPTLCGKSARI
jgi:hypothetical protein